MQNDIRPEWLENDYYKVLGVDKSASASEITKAYRKLARENHPDANSGNSAAEERFKEISAAYEVIGDESKRKSYDQVRAMGPMGAGFSGRGFPPGGGFGGDFSGANIGDLGDMGDLLGSIFAGGGFGGPGGGARRHQSRGSDLEAALTISFDQAATGATTQVQVRDSSGTRTIGVRIPAWIRSGQKVRVAGKGGAGSPRGDLYVVITVGKHPIFGRQGDRLTLDVPVTFTQAALGAEIEVETYSGETKKLRIPKGSQPGSKLRIREGGLPAKKTGGKAGDLIVELRVVVPEELTEEQTEVLKIFDSLLQQDLERDQSGGTKNHKVSSEVNM